MARDLHDETLVQRADPLLGAVLDRRFRIDERLAAGGFGAIYRAEHISSKREVALKVLLPSMTHDPGVVARFRREGATLTTLRSPNTVTAYELGEAPDGTLYIVMELLRGVTLFERFRTNGRMPWRTMAEIARAVCRSLEEAHGLGIIHRDLKPTNIHLEPGPHGEDVVKVLDFGIAKILQGGGLESQDLTAAGQMIGTLDYMSPEQMVGGVVTGQTDIYTLGIVMYEMVAGRRPFDDAESAVAVLAQMLKSDPTPLIQRVPVSPAFDTIVMRCLARGPERRFADVRALGAALDELVADEANDVTRARYEVSEVTTAYKPGTFDDPHEAATVLAGDAINESGVFTADPPSDEKTMIGSARGRGRPGAEPSITYTPTPTTTPRAPSHAAPPRPQPAPAAPAAAIPSAPPAAPPVQAAAPLRAMPPAAASPALVLAARPSAPTQPAVPTVPAAMVGAPYGAPQGMLGPPGPYGAPEGYGPYPQPGVRYDMAAIAAREAAVRRLVWIAVLAGGTILGIILATQL